MRGQDGKSYVLFNSDSSVGEWIMQKADEIGRIFPAPRHPTAEEKAVSAPGGTSVAKTGKKVSVAEWKEKAACLIQMYFRNFRKKAVLKTLKRRGTVVKMPDYSDASKLVMTRGKAINGRLTINRAYFCQTTRQLRVSVYDCETKRTQTFILDNFRYDSMTLEEFEGKMADVLENMAYNEALHAYFMGISEPTKDESHIIGIIQPRSSVNSSVATSHIMNSEHEIYRGLKKLGGYFYNIKVNITLDRKSRVRIFREEDNRITTLDVHIDLREYFAVDGTDEGELRLGRMIYNAVCVGSDSEPRIDAAALQESVATHALSEVSKRLTHLQARFRSCFAREKLRSQRSLQQKRWVLKTQFALRMGRQYHLIKIVTDTERPDVVVVRSDRAGNEVEFEAKALGLEREDGELHLTGEKMKNLVAKTVAFDPKRKLLVRHVRLAKKKPGADKC